MKELINQSKEVVLEELRKETQALFDYIDVDIKIDSNNSILYVQFLTLEDYQALKEYDPKKPWSLYREFGLKISEDNINDKFFMKNVAPFIPQDILFKYYELQEAMNEGFNARELVQRIIQIKEIEEKENDLPWVR